MNQIDVTLKLASNYSVWLPLLTSIIAFRKGSLTRGIKPIFVLIILSLISDIISIYLAKQYGNNMPWFHTYQVLEGFILTLYFFNLFGRKRYWLFIGFLFIGFLVINSIFIGSIFTFNTRGTSVSAIYFIINCLIYYHTIYSSEKHFFIEKSAHFWIVTGILVYYSGSFFTFLSYETFQTWMFHNMANTLKNILLSFGFLLSRKNG